MAGGFRLPAILLPPHPRTQLFAPVERIPTQINQQLNHNEV